MRALLVIALAAALPLACGKKKERAPLAPGVTSAPSLPAPLQDLKDLASSYPTAAAPPPPALASALGSALALPIASASASIVASASASAAPAPGAQAMKLVGLWGFAAFDLSDPDTSTKWKSVPETMQKEILAEAPKATIEFTSTKLISRLSGVPDKTSMWQVETESDKEVVIKTNDEGRKKITFPMPDAIRIEELDKKGAFVTLFARRKYPVTAPSASASASK
jgi:hypothetical protein